MTPRYKSCTLLPDEPMLPQTMLGYDAIMGHGSHGQFESNPSWTSVDHHMSTLLYSLNLLNERVHQAKSLVCLFASSFTSDQHTDFQVDPTSMIRVRVSSLVQEIVSLSSSMMFTCQQMSLPQDPNLGHGNPKDIGSIDHHDIHHLIMQSSAYIDRERNNHGILSQDASQEVRHEEIAGSNMFGSGNDPSMSRWFDRSEDFTNANLSYGTSISTTNTDQAGHYEMIIEMDAADILAKYTHFCQVCNKGFKRDANLRMHMRAHGDEYKSTAALANPKKNDLDNTVESMSHLQMAKRYSCPQDGCRWNRKHPKFQPLKSMICVKNHYKRSHCPKMYVCKRCNQKEFSVVSDLRTHEKHCGYLKWRCSCGTTFSRKDKLLGHVGLFVGHAPIM